MAMTMNKIEHDESQDRTYIPLPVGWEIQTKGKGSSFRLCDTKTGRRLLVPDSPYLHEMLERMAREIHADAACKVTVNSEPDAWQRSIKHDNGEWLQWSYWHDAIDYESPDEFPKRVGRWECKYRPLYSPRGEP